MGHVIEFGHSLVLERLWSVVVAALVVLRWWTAGLPAAGEPWRFMSHAEWQRRGQSEGTFTGVGTMWRKMWGGGWGGVGWVGVD